MTQFQRHSSLTGFFPDFPMDPISSKDSKNDIDTFLNDKDTFVSKDVKKAEIKSLDDEQHPLNFIRRPKKIPVSEMFEYVCRKIDSPYGYIAKAIIGYSARSKEAHRQEHAINDLDAKHFVARYTWETLNRRVYNKDLKELENKLNERYQDFRIAFLCTSEYFTIDWIPLR